jgi:hypothetical protein
MSAAPSGKSEDLGTKLIEGVSAQGTRLTTTIPAGAAGNDLPITIVDERWHSPELQITLVSQHSDPRTGTTVYRLSKISRANPSPLLFEIPAGFTITDVK